MNCINESTSTSQSLEAKYKTISVLGFCVYETIIKSNCSETQCNEFESKKDAQKWYNSLREKYQNNSSYKRIKPHDKWILKGTKQIVTLEKTF